MHLILISLTVYVTLIIILCFHGCVCRGLFSRSSQKEPVQGWKLFGKVPAKDVRDNSSEPHYQASSFDRGNPRWLKLSINYLEFYGALSFSI